MSEWRRMDETWYLRQRAIVLARESGMTWRAIGKRHGISGARAQQIYADATWNTGTMDQQRNALRKHFGY